MLANVATHKDGASSSSSYSSEDNEADELSDESSEESSLRPKVLDDGRGLVRGTTRFLDSDFFFDLTQEINRLFEVEKLYFRLPAYWRRRGRSWGCDAHCGKGRLRLVAVRETRFASQIG